MKNCVSKLVSCLLIFRVAGLAADGTYGGAILTTPSSAFSKPVSGVVPVANGSCERDVFVQYRSGEAGREKIGFPEFEFGTPTVPSPRYLTKTATDSAEPDTKTFSGNVADTIVVASSGKYPVRGTLTFETRATWVSNLCTQIWYLTNQAALHGFLTDYSNCEALEDVSGNGSQTNTVVATLGEIGRIEAFYYVGTLYLDALLAYQPDACGTRTISYDRNQPNNSPTTNITGTACLDGASLPSITNLTHTLQHEGVGSTYIPALRVNELSDEYTTAQLVADATTAAQGAVPAAWGSGRTNTSAGMASTELNSYSYRFVSADALRAEVGQADFRFGISSSEVGMLYVVTWTNRTVTTNGLTTDALGGSETLRGTGQALLTSTRTLPIPSYNATNSILNVRVETMPDPAFFLADGSCATCPGAAAGGSLLPGRAFLGVASVEAMFALGSRDYLSSEGWLLLSETNATAALSTPARLQFQGDTNLTPVLRDTNGVIHEVQAAKCRALVVVSNAFCYDLKLFAKVGGSYQSTPFVIYTIQNPSGGSSTNAVWITEQRSGQYITNKYDYQGGGVWEFIAANGLQTTRVTETFSGTNPVVRTVVREVSGPSSGVISKIKTIYEDGRPTASIVDPDGDALTTTNTYNAAGLLERSVRPDGSWNIYHYDAAGRLVTDFHAFTNQTPSTNTALVRRTTYDYTPLGGEYGVAARPDSPRTEIDYVGTQEVGRRYRVHVSQYERRDYVATSVSQGVDYALGTTNLFYSSGEFENELRAVSRPDGTRDAYSYTLDGGGQRTMTQLTGQASGNADVVRGLRIVTVQAATGEVLSRTVSDIENAGIVVAQDTLAYDEQGRRTNALHLDGTRESWVFQDCCNAQAMTERDGTPVAYAYDALRRITSETRAGITNQIFYDALGQVTRRVRSGAGVAPITVQSSAYDLASRLRRTTNAVGDVTTYDYTLGNGTITTVTQLTNTSSGVTRVITVARDDAPLRVTGSGAHPVRYDYATHSGGLLVREIKLTAAGADTSEVTTNLFDTAGRPKEVAYAAAGAAPKREFLYHGSGQLRRITDPDGVIDLFQYNSKGEAEYTARTGFGYSAIDFGSTSQHRIRRSFTHLTNLTSKGHVIQSVTSVWPTNGNVEAIISTVEQSANGLTNWFTLYGLTTRTEVTFAGSGARYVTNTAPDGTRGVSYFLHGYLQSITVKDTNGTQLGQTTFGYDGHGRRTSTTDARNGTTDYLLDALDRVTAITNAPAVTGGTRQVTRWGFDALGRTTAVTNADSTVVYRDYFDTGELRRTWGSRTYPQEYTYDAQGRVLTLKTWQDFPGGTPATTTWQYDAYRGWLTNKLYDGSSSGPSYSYTAAGRLASRRWARGVTTTYARDNGLGDVTSQSHSSGEPTVSFQYDRLGRVTNVVDASGTQGLRYDLSRRVLSETNFTGTLAGMGLNHTYDALLRRTGLTLHSQLSTLNTAYGYDAASRLLGVTNGVNSAAYAYAANSPLVQALTFRQNSDARLTTTNAFDFLNRLTKLDHQLASFSYAYNAANQRTAVTNADASRWAFEYDDLGQVTSGKKYWSDSAPVAGQQFEYAFDDLGNRTSTEVGGDASGNNQRPATYTANALNQITQRTVPAYLDILGSATNTATVTVNNTATSRKSDYYRAELTIANSSAPVWQGITNVAVLAVGTNDYVGGTTGHVFIAKTPETFTYDADGNLTSDGRWTNRWDAENRLFSMTSHSSGPAGSRLDLRFGYDWLSRRVSKVLSNWTGSAWAKQSEQKFLYDGWNVIAVLDATNGLQLSFTWGSDLSGTRQGAGGIGGLLSMTVHTGSLTGTYLYAFDGNGNVIALVNASDGSAAAQYEYDPFGRLLRATGPLAFVNPFRFSTKFHDDETGLYCYPFRYYDPVTGRWWSRDPIGENGGLNLNGFVGNSPLNAVDPLGLADGSTGISERIFPTAQLQANKELDAFARQHAARLGLNEDDCDYKRLKEFLDARWEGVWPDWQLDGERLSAGMMTEAELRAGASIAGAVAGNYVENIGPPGVKTVATKTASAAAGALMVRKSWLDKLKGCVAKKCSTKTTGQIHHIISTKVWRAINDHRLLKDVFERRDPRFVTQAVDDAAHRGYQRWHRDLDREVVRWIERNPKKNADDFLNWLRDRYEEPDLKERFPNGF